LALKRQLGLTTAILVVVASMIGTGIFITTGTLLKMTHNAFLILILWVVGGIVAITGSLCYAELATVWPDVGGEYVYLKNTFGFLPSFLTGWISLVVGFSAPVATSSISLVKYLNQFWLTIMQNSGDISNVLSGDWTQRIIAAAIIFIFGSIHILGVKRGSRIQNVLTLIKLLIVVSLVGFGIYMADWSMSERLSSSYPWAEGEPTAGIPIYGLVLLIIMFSYSGWNGASYIGGEIKNPGRNLPRALFFGTLITMVIYIGLNVVFLMSTPGQELMGKDAVGAVASRNLFGAGVSSFFTLGIAVILLSSVSVQMMIGPRVYYAMARDRMIFQYLAYENPRFNTPSVSISIQMVLAIFYVFVGTAQTLMEYMGFALSIFPLLTVVGLVYLRYKKPNLNRPFRVPLYPIIPMIYIVLTVGMMVAGFLAWTRTSWFAIMVVVMGIPIFYLWRWIVNRRIASDK
jgi:APA family basic amino acid/polyamine antiporter